AIGSTRDAARRVNSRAVASMGSIGSPRGVRQAVAHGEHDATSGAARSPGASIRADESFHQP
ncbi:MAG TPA: hypothetical protein VLT33_17385, partial [Labilithrix sp.]|nr:hypothetical protein [Labilithrix sp.]